MNVQITPTTEQLQRALAHVYGCGCADVRVEGLVDIEITTDLDGANKARRALSKVKDGSAWE